MTKLISKKKKIYPPTSSLLDYLQKFNRTFDMPVGYDDLMGFSDAIPLQDAQGEDTLWLSLCYDPQSRDEIYHGLLSMYAHMRTEDSTTSPGHLEVDRVDLCTYGNTKPIRVRITNKLNDNFEYFYVKRSDANRIYGLELEHILSPNRIGFFASPTTLIEEHIYGIPGDMLLEKYFHNTDLNKVRLAKEFVKFNERCTRRLLGDMHASNFVVDITMDFEMNFYRIRAIDFDQQSYEGSLKVYRPQFFKQNSPFVQMVMDTLDPETISQYKQEERSVIHKRMRSSRFRLDALIDVMTSKQIAPGANVKSLREDLAEFYRDSEFLSCQNMAEVLLVSLHQN